MNNSYDASTIGIIKGLDVVRKRPGVYMGGQANIRYQMIWEVIDNSMDEFIEGHATKLDININDNTYIFEDDGRGIPVDIHPEEQVSSLQLVLSNLHAGGKFNQENYSFSSGLHGVGISAVNALSSLMKVEVFRDGKHYAIEYEHGQLTKPLHILGDCDHSGTKVTFIPDMTLDTIEDSDKPHYDTIHKRLSEVCFLNPNFTINFSMNGKEKKYHETHFSHIVTKYMQFGELLGAFNNIIESHDNTDDYELDIVTGWSKKGGSAKILSFTNGTKQEQHGDHVTGFLRALTGVIRKNIEKYQADTKKKFPSIKQEDIEHGLVLALSLRMRDPHFDSQTKRHLSSKGAYNYVRKLSVSLLTKYFEEHPQYGILVMQKVIEAAARREASTKARETYKADMFTVPSKLASCSSNKPEECELFIVEGDSAGGSLRVGRNRRYQAVLPIQGKLINVARASLGKVYKVKEIRELMATLGMSSKQKSIENIPYHKIIIMTDADMDGLHILTLILMFFLEICPEIVLNGYLYVIYPPLYKVTAGKSNTYVKNDEELANLIDNRFLNNYDIQVDNNVLELYDFQKMWSEFHRYINMIIQDNLSIPARVAVLISHYSDSEYLAKMLDCEVISNDRDDYQVEVSTYSTFYGKVNYKVKISNNYCQIPQIFQNGKELYFDSIYELFEFINNKRNEGISIQRFKGLGEMNPDELAKTCVKPEHRNLIRIEVSKDEYTDVYERCRVIMSYNDERRNLIREHFNILDTVLPHEILTDLSQS